MECGTGFFRQSIFSPKLTPDYRHPLLFHKVDNDTVFRRIFMGTRILFIRKQSRRGASHIQISDA